LALGLVSRNVRAVAAPLLAVSGVHPRALVMLALAIPITVLWSFLVAIWFGCRAAVIEAEAKLASSLVVGVA